MKQNSAGGGGKSEYRQSKINAKNVKLNDERQRTTKQMHKEKDRKARSKANGGGNGAGQEETANSGAGAGAGAGAGEEDAFAGIHPSRRNRMA